LEQALARGEFTLHYQPKVNLRQGRVIGVEALIRWRHPEGRLVPPAEFLPLMEGTELMVAVGEWVIGEALDQMARWREAGLLMPVAVNIAPRHLAREDFVARLERLLADHLPVPAGHLQLEVVESAALADIEHVARRIEACRQLGVTFALDDFGTGYASLTYLRRLPADLVKIDQSFVRDLLFDQNDLAIVEGIIGLTEAFGMTVLAEGVETEAHVRALLRLGCALGQGYGIARPMPASDVPSWVAGWRPPSDWLEVAEELARRRKSP